MPDPMPKEQKSANFQRLLQRQNEISWEKHQRYVGGDVYKRQLPGTSRNKVTKRGKQEKKLPV